MEIHLVFQGANDPPQLAHLKRPIVDVSENERMTFALIEKGMQSGEPSVMMIVEDGEGSIVLQTSFDKFLTAAHGFMSGAEAKWGWTRPEGHMTLLPPDKETRKVLLEAIKKELEEWDNAD